MCSSYDALEYTVLGLTIAKFTVNFNYAKHYQEIITQVGIDVYLG